MREGGGDGGGVSVVGDDITNASSIDGYGRCDDHRIYEQSQHPIRVFNLCVRVCVCVGMRCDCVC